MAFDSKGRYCLSEENKIDLMSYMREMGREQARRQEDRIFNIMNTSETSLPAAQGETMATYNTNTASGDPPPYIIHNPVLGDITIRTDGTMEPDEWRLTTSNNAAPSSVRIGDTYFWPNGQLMWFDGLEWRPYYHPWPAQEENPPVSLAAGEEEIQEDIPRIVRIANDERNK